MIKKSVSLIAFATVLGAFGGAYAAAGDNTIVTSKAYVDNTKQEKIAGHESGAADSLLTDSETDGTVQKRAIFNDTAANYDSTTQSTQIPTMGAVMSAVSAGTNAVDISSHTINGAPLSNSASYFYGVSDTGGRTATKVVRIPSITQQTDGLMIFVSFTRPDFVADGTTRRLQLIGSDGNGNEVTFPAGDMIYRGSYLAQQDLARDVLGTGHVTMWIRKGNDWHFIGGGESNHLLAIDQGILGTSAEENVVSAANLKQIIQGTTLTGLSTSDATAVAATDSITTGIGKLQAQITDITADIPTLPTGTSGTVVTYNGVDANNVQQYSENAVASAPVYENGTLTNPNSLATIAAVETKQNKIAASEWEDGSGNTIPGVVISTDENGVVEQRMILDKTENITNAAIATTVARGYDDRAGYSITEDIHSDSVGVNDVNNAVPTTTMTIAIANAATAPLPWATAEQNATGAYNTTFADSGTNVWPTADADKVVKGQTFANAMATKQNKIGVEDDDIIPGQQGVTGMRAVLAPTDTAGIVNQIGLWDADGGDSVSWDLHSAYDDADERNLIARSIPTVGAVEVGLNNKQNKIAGHSANAADSLLTDSATDGTVQKRAIFNDTAANYDSTTQSTQIPTMGAVMSAISAGVSAAAPSGTPNTIANYGANGALGSGIATYSGATQQSPYNAGNDAGKIATAAAVETKQTKKVCYDWPDGVEHTDANCWLWTLPD